MQHHVESIDGTDAAIHAILVMASGMFAQAARSHAEKARESAKKAEDQQLTDEPPIVHDIEWSITGRPQLTAAVMATLRDQNLRNPSPAGTLALEAEEYNLLVLKIKTMIETNEPVKLEIANNPGNVYGIVHKHLGPRLQKKVNEKDIQRIIEQHKKN